MPRRKKIIQIPPGNVEKLMKVMKCSRSAVFNALAYRSDSAAAQAIRSQAMSAYGGIETYKYIL